MKLLVRNLPRSLSEQQLRSMFETLGLVQSCTLVVDKKSGVSKGFAFVEMPKPGEAKAATKVLNGQEVDGQRIRVKKADKSKAESETVAPSKPNVWRQSK